MDAAPVFVSGCYIVRDEEELLARSLQALRGFVDELVVYDTGSVDRTMQIARECGARVVQGYWDDDFGAARNRALAHCRGEWVVCVDADEVAVGDAAAFRRELGTTTADWFTLAQVSGIWDGTDRSLACLVPRVLRRSRCRWQGALHERIVGDGAPVEADHLEHLLLEHSGYDLVRSRRRSKGERNLVAAEKGLADARAGRGDHVQVALVEVGRAACGAERHRRALEAFAEVDRSRLPVEKRILAAHAAVLSALAVGELGVAGEWLAAMEAWGETEQVCRGFEARIALAAGDGARAEALLREQAHLPHVDSCVTTGLSFADTLIDALMRQGKLAEAADLLLEHLASYSFGASPAVSLALLGRVGGGVQRLVQALPEALVVPWIAQLRDHDAWFTDAFFEAMWTAGRARTAVLVAVSAQWASLPFERALLWSLRLREAGLEQHCPLRRILADERRDSRSRLLSGAVLVEVGETQALQVLEPLLAAVAEEDVPGLLAQLQQVAPRLSATLVPA